MASEGIERADTVPVEKSVDGTKRGNEHQDVEVGPEMINIDRIEKVYAFVPPQTLPLFIRLGPDTAK
jgi:hypothetical protein